MSNPPSGRLATCTVPPWASTTSRTMARPRPEPGMSWLPSARQNRSHSRASSAAATPGPSSRTRSRPSASTTRTRPSGGVHLPALSRRLVTARSSRAALPRTDVGSSSSTTSRRWWRRVRSAAPSTISSRRISRQSSVARRLSVARSTSSATSAESSSTSRTASSTIWSRSPTGRALARCRSSTFVRRLVKGVRSSWLASVISRFCCSREVARAASMALNASARRPNSSVRSTTIRACSSWVAATCSAVSVSARTGRRARRATATPSSAATPTPSRATASKVRRSSPRLDSRGSRGRASCTAPERAELRSCRGTVIMRYGLPSTVTSVRTSARSPRATSRSASLTGSSTWSAGWRTRPACPTIWNSRSSAANGSARAGNRDVRSTTRAALEAVAPAWVSRASSRASRCWSAAAR